MNDNFIDEYFRQNSAFLYITACSTASVKINEQNVSALMNSEAEISVMLFDLVKKLRLLISHIFIVIISDAIEANKRFIRLYENISININRVIYKAAI
jgi:hypothetical protein